MTAANARAAAAAAVAAVLGGRNLEDALAAQSVAPRDRPLLANLAYGVLRDWRLLEWLAGHMAARRDTPVALAALLAVGLHQLRSMRTAEHAAVAETVAASAGLGLAHAKGMVNAILRRYLRERDALEAAVPDEPAIRQSHPDWLVQLLRGEWPQWAELLAANQQAGPLTLRVNRRKATRDACVEQLRAAGIDAHVPVDAPDAVVLAAPRPVGEIPGFSEGVVSVQDAAAQRVAELVAPAPGQRVLDACAAPGGKAAHLLEQADIELTAIDVDAQRLRRVQDNLERLGLTAEVRAADATQPQAWWDGRTYDCVLVDAPCSGTGVIRRHPDIKWLRRASDIPQLAAQQRRLLDALWPCVAPGGTLVYAVCSVLRTEGDAVVGTFLADRTDAAAEALAVSWGEATAHGRRLPPGGDFDGFYYARIGKRA